MTKIVKYSVYTPEYTNEEQDIKLLENNPKKKDLIETIFKRDGKKIVQDILEKKSKKDIDYRGVYIHPKLKISGIVRVPENGTIENYEQYIHLLTNTDSQTSQSSQNYFITEIYKIKKKDDKLLDGLEQNVYENEFENQRQYIANDINELEPLIIERGSINQYNFRNELIGKWVFNPVPLRKVQNISTNTLQITYTYYYEFQKDASVNFTLDEDKDQIPDFKDPDVKNIPFGLNRIGNMSINPNRSDAIARCVLRAKSGGKNEKIDDIDFKKSYFEFIPLSDKNISLNNVENVFVAKTSTYNFNLVIKKENFDKQKLNDGYNEFLFRYNCITNAGDKYEIERPLRVKFDYPSENLEKTLNPLNITLNNKDINIKYQFTKDELEIPQNCNIIDFKCTLQNNSEFIKLENDNLKYSLSILKDCPAGTNAVITTISYILNDKKYVLTVTRNLNILKG